MSTGTRHFWYIAVTFLRDYFLIGLIERGMTLLGMPGLDSKKLSALRLHTMSRMGLVFKTIFSLNGPPKSFTTSFSTSCIFYLPLNEHVRQLVHFYC